MHLFITAIVIGFSVAAPLGPIGILCFENTLKRGYLNGIISGAGAAFADAIYSSVAAFSMSIIVHFLFEHQRSIRLIGGFLLIYLSIKIFFSKNSQESQKISRKGLGVFLSTFFLTLTNPLTILLFMSVFASINFLNANINNHFFYSIIVIIGVFIGSMGWWLILCSTVNFFKKKKSAEKFSRWSHRLSAIILLIFALVSFYSIFIEK